MPHGRAGFSPSALSRGRPNENAQTEYRLPINNGVADDDGVVMATYQDTTFGKARIETIADIREATTQACLRRVRPCLMTTATTVLALLPVLTSSGRGSDILVPMAIPTFGGMLFQVITMIVVPVIYCWREEARLLRNERSKAA
jgi:Cu(I)/Ag(I) efflux system membrane protein CusA/SilA